MLLKIPRQFCPIILIESFVLINGSSSAADDLVIISTAGLDWSFWLGTCVCDKIAVLAVDMNPTSPKFGASIFISSGMDADVSQL